MRVQASVDAAIVVRRVGEPAAIVGPVLAGAVKHERFTIGELAGNGLPSTVDVTAEGPERAASFTCRVRIDTPTELDYYRHGGILPYVVHRLATTSSSMSSH